MSKRDFEFRDLPKFLRLCKNSNTNLKNIPESEDEICNFLNESYNKIGDLEDDLAKIGVSYLIEELNGDYNFNYKNGKFKKRVRFNVYNDLDDETDHQKIAQNLTDLARVFRNWDTFDILISVAEIL